MPASYWLSLWKERETSQLPIPFCSSRVSSLSEGVVCGVAPHKCCKRVGGNFSNINYVLPSIRGFPTLGALKNAFFFFFLRRYPFRPKPSGCILFTTQYAHLALINHAYASILITPGVAAPS
uniref:Uncharacterized protein n=1 Tax=Varanus komodoensis TaxID=61221 RepID=A0A8D2Q3I2_VARKO